MLPKIERILYCTQLGPNTAYVFRHAYGLAKALGAELYVLHVVATLKPVQARAVDGWAGEGAIGKIVESEGQRDLARIPRRLEEFCEREIGGNDWRTVVTKILMAEGKANEQILTHIDSLAADLVVMGAHAESPFLDRIVGNTAQRVLRHSPVPVLLCQVPQGKQELTLDS